MKYALGVGIGSQDNLGGCLEVYYPHPILLTELGSLTLGTQIMSSEQLIGLNIELDQQLCQHPKPLILCVIKLDEPAQDVPASYLKLHLISHRKIKPHDTNLEGLFALLPNIAWTNHGAIAVQDLAPRQLAARIQGTTIIVRSVDKFPQMTDYVVPTGVRIADSARVRLGAYLGEGTTIMHEGFVNFNAGTEGPNMIEGRISSGVFVGKNSDLGGGCSTMGTLSGGGNIVISLGENCLIGANAGTGIPLGDRCTIESGLYITAGTKTILIDKQGKAEEHPIKTSQLAGKNDLLFRRNSITGTVECLTNHTAASLNSILHENN